MEVSKRGYGSFKKRAQEKQMKPGCESCKSKFTGDHSWSCGDDNHASRHFTKSPRNQKGNCYASPVMAVINQKMIKIVNSLNRSDIVLISIKRKTGRLNGKQVEALWDTEAQCSIISKCLVNLLFEESDIRKISELLQGVP